MKQVAMVVLVAGTMLAGCNSQPSALPAMGDPQASCGADKMQGLVGQSTKVLSGMSFSGPVRVMGPNDAMTMDYLANRINVIHDGRGTITRVYCG